MVWVAVVTLIEPPGGNQYHRTGVDSRLAQSHFDMTGGNHPGIARRRSAHMQAASGRVSSSTWLSMSAISPNVMDVPVTFASGRR